MNPINPKWPGMDDAAWEACKGAVHISRGLPSHVQKGLAYDAITSSLIAEVDALRAMVRAQNENLSAVQETSTRQCNQIRGFRYFVDGGTDYREALNEITGAGYAAVCKHGPVHPRLTNIPDGTGGAGTIKARLIAQAECSRAERDGSLTWRLLAEEEFSEVVAETDPAKLRAELAQLGAVVVAWIQAIDIRGAK